MSAGLGGVERQLPLRHEAQVGAADLELRLHDLERALVVGQGLRQDLLALARGDLGRERVLHFAERAQPDARVGRDAPASVPPSGSRPAS